MAKETNLSLSKHQSDIPASGKVWDIPLRLFHWLLMFAVIGAIASSKMENWFWHEKMGLTILGLISFRFIWGVIGTPYARFSSFSLKPHLVIAYIRSRLKGDRTYYPGHAPTGSWATIILLAVLGSMAGFGTMANNDILFEGPLAAWAGDFSNTATDWHEALEPVLFSVLIAHILALLIYRIWLKINLVPAMITGGKDISSPLSTPVGFSRKHQLAGVILLAVMIAGAQSLGFIGDRYYF